MKDDRETAFNYIVGDRFASFFSAEKKWINRLRKLKEQYPDEIVIRAENTDGSLYTYIPASWLRISPKRKNTMTAEQIAASRARLEIGRQKKLEMMRNGDDAQETGEKDVT